MLFESDAPQNLNVIVGWQRWMLFEFGVQGSQTSLRFAAMDALRIQDALNGCQIADRCFRVNWLSDACLCSSSAALFGFHTDVWPGESSVSSCC